MVDELHEVARTHPTIVFFAENDPLFPAAEIAPKLGDSICIVRLPYGHETPGSTRGHGQIKTAFEHLRAA